MSNPALAGKAEDGGRFYTFGNPPESYWSVTTIIGGGVPKHLQAHYAKLTAELALEDLRAHPSGKASAAIRRWAKAGRAWVLERQAAGELTSVKVAKLSDLELAGRWLKGAADRHRDKAAELGSDVHDEAERFVLAHGETLADLVWSGATADDLLAELGRGLLPEWDDRIGGHMRSFLRFLVDYRPRYIATEATVFNRTQAYAGTLDAIFELEFVEPESTSGFSSVRLLTDYKSGRAVYEEVALQLAAYSEAEFIGLPDGVTELPLPPIDAGAVLHIKANGDRAKLRLVRIDDPVFRAFLFAREVYRWRTEIAGTVLLQELEPPATEEVA
jgi:hypothetical protein